MTRIRVGFAAGLMVSALALGACATGGGGGGGYTPSPLAAGCIDSSNPIAPDFLYNGTPNVLGNAVSTQVAGVDSFDGTCTGDPGTPGVIVQAADGGAASAICTGLGVPVANPANLSAFGYEVPGDFWTCLEV